MGNKYDLLMISVSQVSVEVDTGADSSANQKLPTAPTEAEEVSPFSHHLLYCSNKTVPHAVLLFCTVQGIVKYTVTNKQTHTHMLIVSVMKPACMSE